MKYLITGITGFVGSHMADYILSKEPSSIVCGTKRERSQDNNIKHLFNNGRVSFYLADLLDKRSLDNLINKTEPDYVLHFAAQSCPQDSFHIINKTLSTNILGTQNLLESIRYSQCSPSILSVSSSEVYGNLGLDEIPINENNPIRAGNPYSVSKVGHDLISQYYHKAYGLKIIITRMFSHEGARRGRNFALSSFAYQIAEHEKSKKDPPYKIRHGNLDSVRTYNHIDDAIRAYWLCIKSDKFGEIYNIGGDHTCTVGDALDMLISKSKISEKFVKVLDPKLIRPVDVTLQIPDSSKFRKDFDWKPKKGLDSICDDLLNYWRSIL